MEGYLYFNHIEDEIAHIHSYMSNQLLEMKNLHLKFSKIAIRMCLLSSLMRQELFKQLYEEKRIKNNFSEII
jgi:hypothetical protein